MEPFSNNNDNNRSRLAGSTWTPSSGPYDTHHQTSSSSANQPHSLQAGYQPLGGAGMAGGYYHNDDYDSGGVEEGTTPNSLNQPPSSTTTGHHVQFSRAEYKAPNSLQNSLDDQGTTGGTHRTFGEVKNKSYVERYADVKQAIGSSPTRSNLASSAGRVRSGEDDDDDDNNNQTALERWERRKERKMMEKGGMLVSSPGAPAQGSSYVTPTSSTAYQESGTRRTVTRDEGDGERSAYYHTERGRAVTPSRAARQVHTDRSTRWSPTEDDTQTQDTYDHNGGYQEYDDFGTTRERDDRHQYKREGRGEHKFNERRGRARGEPYGRSRTRSPSVERNRSRSKGRPDPLGHRESSLGKKPHDDDDENGGSCYNENENNEESDAHFDEERGRHRTSSTQRRNSTSRSLSRSRSRTSRSRSQSRNKKSSYADDLKSFTESIAAPVAAARQQGILRTHDERTYKPYSDELRPEMGVPVGSGSDQSYTVEIEEEEDSGGSRRVRHRASDMCKRFTGRDCNSKRRGDQNRGSSGVSKSKKRYMWMALSICGACILAAGLSVYFIDKKRNDEKLKEDEGVDGDPKVESLVPSLIPTNMPITSPTVSPTNRPSSDRDILIMEYLSSLSKGLSDVDNTPQYYARQWILYEDTLDLHLPLVNMGFKGTNQVGDWNSPVAIRIKQRYALATLYFSMGVGTGGVVDGWLSGDECEFIEGVLGQRRQAAWDGVGCDENGMVRVLVLDGANLQGEIPSDISLLSSMENLIIKNNPGLTGTIPHTIGEMRELRQLGLYSNGLSSTIPKNIFRLEELVYLNLSDNTLVGIVPWEEIGNHLKKIHRLILHNNLLEGEIEFHELAKIPSLLLLSMSNNLFDGNIETVGLISSLEYLYLDGNKFVGSIPTGISDLSQLKGLNLDENALHGTLPHTIGNLTSLEYLSVKGNTISGKLPASMKTMKSLSTLNLAGNAMSGNLQHLKHISNLKNVHLYQNTFTGHLEGTLFGSLSSLEVLLLSSNSLTGTIPSDVAGAQRTLKGLYLSDNNFEGGIPEEVCALYKLEDLFLDDNDLQGTLPSCLGNLSALRQLYAFKNHFVGNVPRGVTSLPYLSELGIEQNDFRGIDQHACAGVRDKSLSIWADCTELGGCDCCDRCCSDQNNDC